MHFPVYIFPACTTSSTRINIWDFNQDSGLTQLTSRYTTHVLLTESTFAFGTLLGFFSDYHNAKCFYLC